MYSTMDNNDTYAVDNSRTRLYILQVAYKEMDVEKEPRQITVVGKMVIICWSLL